MTDLLSSIDNFFLKEKERFIQEFSQYFSPHTESNNLKIRSDLFEKILESDILKLYTDSKGFFKIKEYENSADNNIDKILSKCCDTGNLEIIKVLVESNTKFDHNNALRCSAESGNLEIVKYLVELDAKINDESDALYISSFNGYLDIVKYLVKHGATIDNSGALECSAMHGDIDIVKYLVESGATINNTAALEYSTINGHFNVVKYLVKHNADIGDAITKEDNEINRFLYMHSKPNQEHLFNPKIVSELKSIKELIN